MELTFSYARDFLDGRLRDLSAEGARFLADNDTVVNDMTDQRAWERLGRGLEEVADAANARADATADVDGPAWDRIVETCNEARSTIYPNGVDYRATDTTRERRESVHTLLLGLRAYLD